jgi:hypothetical protein
MNLIEVTPTHGKLRRDCHAVRESLYKVGDVARGL